MGIEPTQLQEQLELAYATDFDRCISFTKCRMEMYGRGEIPKRTMEKNVEHARMRYGQLINKSWVLLHNLNEIERELGMEVTQ